MIGRSLLGLALAVIPGVAVLLASPASAASAAAGAPDWFPLRGDHHLIGCAYNGTGGVCQGNYHPYWAIDIGGTVGETVYAAGKGTVSKTETHQGGNCPVATHETFESCPDGSKGNFVLIDHGSGIFSFYEHLQTVTKNIGDTVDETTPIGTVGISGWTTPTFPHLHFERRTGGTKVDPGPLKACVGSTLTTYPQAFGAAYNSWQGLPGHKFTARSDGTACANSLGGGGGKPKVDLVFAIDTTGSMTPYISSVQASARQITTGLFARADARVALLDYKDLYACPGDGYAARVDLAFSTDPAAFDTAVGTLTAIGGCDTPESVYSGLMAAIHLPWRNGAKKAIILMGDAPPHDPEPSTGFTLAAVTAAAKAVDPATIYAINIGGGGSPYFDDLAAQNDGQAFVADNPDTAVTQITDAIATITTLIADAGGPYLGAVGEPVTFDASTSTVTGANIAQYQWDYNGDGTYDETTTLPTATHTYSAPYAGNLGVRITTDAATPQSATASAPVQILIPTTVKYTGQTNGAVGESIHMGATLTDPTGAAVSGASIAFTLGTQSCTGTTNAQGKAECATVATQDPGDYDVAADATPKSPYFRSGTGVPFTLTRTATSPTPTPSAEETSGPPTAPGGLAATGAALDGIVVTGATLVGAGVIVLFLVRRRRSAQPPVV